MVLRHTTEEVLDACIEAIEPVRAAMTSHLRSQVMDEIGEGLKKHTWFTGFDISDDIPKRLYLDEWIKQAKEEGAVVFIAGTKKLTHSIIKNEATILIILNLLDSSWWNRRRWYSSVAIGGRGSSLYW